MFDPVLSSTTQATKPHAAYLFDIAHMTNGMAMVSRFLME
jgi:hypothetical protein